MFDDIKLIVEKDIILSYENFNKHFDIHMDASIDGDYPFSVTIDLG